MKNFQSNEEAIAKWQKLSPRNVFLKRVQLLIMDALSEWRHFLKTIH